MTTKSTRPKPLTFVLGPPDVPAFQKTVTVGPLDTENRPDAPAEEQREVVLASSSYDQCLNNRLYEAKLDVGQQVRRKVFERHLGHRFFLDVRELPRLLAIEAVKLPEELEVESALDEQLAELEAKRAEIEVQRQQQIAELRE